MGISSWLRSRKRPSPQGQRRPRRAAGRPATSRPGLEALESRNLPSFGTYTFYPVGATPQAVVTADLNHDGILDLVTANQGTFNPTFPGTYSGGGVSVLLGLAGNNGKKAPASGTFAAAQTYATGPAVSVAVGDFNGDGQLDIATGIFDRSISLVLAGGGPIFGTLSVLLGNGDGTFRQGPTTDGGGGSYTAVADLNGDGKLDLISDYGGTSVWLGNGDGSFRAGPAYGSVGDAVAAGDFNADGKLDVVAAGPIATGGFTLSLLLGNGDGTFAAARTLASVWASGLPAVTVADFNNDGKLDLAFAYMAFPVPNDSSQSIGSYVLLGNGDGTFPPLITLPGGSIFAAAWTQVTALSVGDFNHDGKLDLVAVGTQNLQAAGSLWLGNGDGTFGGEQSVSPDPVPTFPTAIAVGDFNGDGYADLAVVGAGGLEVLLWNTKK
jgi:hypothetical protein